MTIQNTFRWIPLLNVEQLKKVCFFYLSWKNGCMHTNSKPHILWFIIISSLLLKSCLKVCPWICYWLLFYKWSNSQFHKQMIQTVIVEDIIAAVRFIEWILCRINCKQFKTILLITVWFTFAWDFYSNDKKCVYISSANILISLKFIRLLFNVDS